MKTRPCVSDIELERFALKELPQKQMQRIARYAESDPELALRLAYLRQSNDDILARYPASEIVPKIEGRSRPEALQKENRTYTTRLLYPALAVSTAGITLILIFTLIDSQYAPKDAEEPETIIIKGPDKPELFIFRKMGNAEEQLLEDETVEPGDIIQLKYASRRAQYGVIFSIDGRNEITLHFPLARTESTKLIKGGAHPLRYAYELDDAPDFEQFFFVTSNAPLNIAKVLEAGRKLHSPERDKLDLPSEIEQTHFLLKKRAASSK